MDDVTQYVLTDIDDLLYPRYYGYLANDGDWFILKQNLDGSLRIARASVNNRGLYTNTWQARTSQTYMFWETSF